EHRTPESAAAGDGQHRGARNQLVRVVVRLPQRETVDTRMADAGFAAGGWKTLTEAQRETFLAAIERHRRASWRVTIACALAVAVLAVAVAILMAPLLYCLVGLAFDLVNLATPAPDVMGWMGRRVDRLLSSDHVPPEMFAQAGLIAALPG